MIRTTLVVVLALAPAFAADAPLSDNATFAAYLGSQYRVVPNVTYLTATNFEAKMDLYLARDTGGPVPTLIYIHGGGWTGGNKESSILQTIPYMEMGWNVVNVGYRLARIAQAPAAVEDCLCALRFIIRNAKEYNIDTTRLVVTGHSAGGHLSLTTGVVPASAGLDRQCPGKEELKVAAVVNWYGITDVADILEGPNMQTYAVTWLGSLPNRTEVARRASPLEYVRPGLPPILTIHGDADTTVPYSHALRLRDALNKAGVPNELVTVPGGRHGGFSRAETLRIFAAIHEFLGKHSLLKR